MSIFRRSRPSAALRWRPSVAVRTLRRPLVWWAMVAALALFTAGTINATLSEARAERDRWGSTQTVAIVSRAVPAGDPLASGIEWRDVPRATVPADAVDELSPDATARVALFPGEIVLRARVAGPGSDGLAGRLPPETSALAVPVAVGTPPLAIGDVVDVHATPRGFVGASATTTVARRAIVVVVDDASITLAVADDDVGATAAALSGSDLAIALVG